MDVDSSRVKQILRSHCQHVMQSGNEDVQHIQRITIRRSYLFVDTIKEFGKVSLDLSRPFQVRFYGEPAVDEGGPKRELFRLFKKDLCSKTSMFYASEKGILPVHNLSALAGRQYEVIGRVIAAMILLGGSPPQCFVPEITDFLLYGEVRQAAMDVQCICDCQVRIVLDKVRIWHLCACFCIHVCTCVSQWVCVCAWGGGGAAQ